MKITTRSTGGSYVDTKFVEGTTTIDLGLLNQSERAELAGELRSAADDLYSQPSVNDELLEALKSIVADNEFCGDAWGDRRDAWIATARAAIQKATGEQA